MSKCETCGGSGQVGVSAPQISGYPQVIGMHMAPCPECQTTKLVDTVKKAVQTDPCSHCTDWGRCARAARCLLEKPNPKPAFIYDLETTHPDAQIIAVVVDGHTFTRDDVRKEHVNRKLADALDKMVASAEELHSKLKHLRSQYDN